jgi:hypothetical protein
MVVLANYGLPNSNLHRSIRLELRSQFPCGSPTGMDVRPVQPVEASAKKGKICGFHNFWCINRRDIALLIQFRGFVNYLFEVSLF